MIFLLKLVHVIGNELVSKRFLEVVKKILGRLKKPSKMLCDKKEGFETSPVTYFVTSLGLSAAELEGSSDV